MAMAWALAATATSLAEEGKYEHGFLHILCILHFCFWMQSWVCGHGISTDGAL